MGTEPLPAPEPAILRAGFPRRQGNLAVARNKAESVAMELRLEHVALARKIIVPLARA
jgi:hypothetical protein